MGGPLGFPFSIAFQRAVTGDSNLRQSGPSDCPGSILYAGLAGSCHAGILLILSGSSPLYTEWIGCSNFNFGVTICFCIAALNGIVDMAIRVLTGGIICAVGTVSHIQVVGSRL